MLVNNYLASENYFLLFSQTAVNFFHRLDHSSKELILASEQLIFWLAETIFSLHFSETPASDSFFPSSGNVFFKGIVHSEWFPQAEKEAVNKITLFSLESPIPPAGMKDSLKQYVSTSRKNWFHC